MCSVAICLCSSFVFMGRTMHVPCPSAVLLAFVPTKPCYTIVPVFVKGRCLLLDMSRLGILVLVVLGGICSLPDVRHRFHFPRRERLVALLWERERNLREGSGAQPRSGVVLATSFVTS